MNSTNRFLNRFFILVVGLVVLAAGAALSVGALLPDVQRTISENAERAVGPTTDTMDAQPWILLVAAVAAVVLIVILLWFVLRQGRGHTGTLLQVDEQPTKGTPTGGRVILDVKLAEQVLEEAIGRNPDVVAVDVTGFRIRKQTALRLTVHARRGASPMELRRDIEAAIHEWDAALGTSTPVVVQIVSGLRTRLASTNRVV
ncbi:hypothetical protein ITJ57_17300 [Plantibacter sp. VKM Ac-2880]|uniref:hypothetical protein n=1 Tax=Plantibacter sp. VKM Ac-2880 TaxID=2783827 RepID=UPI00189007AA|nr:hypothetical protein [Plantibacter sp. VKM Ac-2880]MBF4570526.1 hypothetical protein [Plantibacter sp. VKM Ac-2880]